MVKYLHKFDSLKDFEEVYNSNNYLEPWVSVHPEEYIKVTDTANAPDNFYYIGEYTCPESKGGPDIHGHVWGYWVEDLSAGYYIITPSRNLDNVRPGDVYTQIVNHGSEQNPNFGYTEGTSFTIKEVINKSKVKYNKIKYKFGGFQITSGPLCYNNSTYEWKNVWSDTSWETEWGTYDGSTYLSFVEIGKYFDSDGSSFTETSGDIDNSNNINGYRIPTIDELRTILGTTRNGAKVNGVSGCHYAGITLTTTYFNNNEPFGLLLFPDDVSITGIALNNIDTLNVQSGVTIEELNNYINQGCVFIPGAGVNTNGSWYSGGVSFSIPTATTSTSSNTSFVRIDVTKSGDTFTITEYNTDKNLVRNLIWGIK